MKSIIVYSLTDGDILRCVICPDGMEALQCHDGEAYIEHERVNDVLYKIDLTTLEIIPVD